MHPTRPKFHYNWANFIIFLDKVRMGQQNKVQNTLNRRSFLKFSGTALFAGLSATMAYLYLGNEINEPVVEKIDISISETLPGTVNTQ